MSSFSEPDDDLIPAAGSARPFDHDGYAGYDPRLPSQRYESFPHDSDYVKGSAGDSPLFNDNSSYTGRDDVFSQPQVLETDSPSTIYATGGGFSEEVNGKGFDGVFGASDGLILPSPTEMRPEEGFALREWRRQNAIRLEEKEKMEKELLSQILDEADEYKANFIRKRQIACVHNKTTNREKEKLFLAGLEKFHIEADKDYWKTIAELIPKEVPAIENKRGKKDKEKPSITVVQGPKPGKPTDLSRMRHILLKLKHNTPAHLELCPPPAPAQAKDVQSSGSAVTAGPSGAAVAVNTPEAVSVA